MVSIVNCNLILLWYWRKDNLILFKKIFSAIENSEMVSELKKVHEKEKDMLQEENRKLGQEVDRVSFYFIAPWYDKIKWLEVKTTVTVFKNSKNVFFFTFISKKVFVVSPNICVGTLLVIYWHFYVSLIKKSILL